MANHPNRPQKQWFQLHHQDEAVLRALFDLYGAGSLMAVLSRFQVTRDKVDTRIDKGKSEEAEMILRECRDIVVRHAEETLL
jgi:hypothetical protein